MSGRFKGWKALEGERLRKAGKILENGNCSLACGPGDWWEDQGGCICHRKRLWEAAELKGQAARTEEEIHDALLMYIRPRYPWSWPSVHSDLSGFRLGVKAQARIARLKHVRGFPDLVIYEPRGPFNGLALELKKEGSRVYLKDGSLSKDIHIKEQAEWLSRFHSCGFLSKFVVGFNEARAAIEEYQKLPRGDFWRSLQGAGSDPPGSGL